MPFAFKPAGILVREQFEKIGALRCLHNSCLYAEVPVSIRSSAMFFVIADLCKDNCSSSCRTLINRTKLYYTL